MLQSIRTYFCFCPLLLVAGCFGGEPSDKEAHAAFNEAPTGGAGEGLIKEFNLAACKSASGAPGYQCDFTFKLPTGPVRTGSGRFFKAGDKWVVDQVRTR